MPGSPPGSQPERRGASLVAALLWLLALALFAAPFLRAPDAPDPEGLHPEVRSDLDLPFEEDVALFEEDYEPGLGELIAEKSEEWFGEDSPRLEDSGLIDLERMRAGRRPYETHCIGCHGQSGNGAGPAAVHLDPRPRNFRRGVFKFTSTATQDRPLRRDVLDTITRGLMGSSMPDFRLVSRETRLDLVEHVRYLAIRGEFEQLLLDLAWEEGELLEEEDADEAAEIVIERWQEPQTVYPPVAETEYDEESVERGRELYFDTTVANCATCHGDEGKGDGPSATDFEDYWGYPIEPRDLTTGVFRAGAEPEDLYRSIATGINGTPMPSFSGSLTPEQIWDLVHFVQSLSEE